MRAWRILNNLLNTVVTFALLPLLTFVSVALNSVTKSDIKIKCYGSLDCAPGDAKEASGRTVFLLCVSSYVMWALVIWWYVK